MQRGVNAWCFPGHYGIEAVLENAAKIGYDGVELNLDEEGMDPFRMTEGEATSIKKRAQGLGLHVAFGIERAIVGHAGHQELEFVLVDLQDVLDRAAPGIIAFGDPFPGQRVQVVREGGSTADGGEEDSSGEDK